VRPEVEIGAISGLGTVISGPEIQVLPGSGAAKSEFVGMDRAPVAYEGKGLRIVLRAAHPERLIWVVGDSWIDGAAAQAGGAAFIAYRIHPDELSRRAVTARAVIHDLRALPEHLASYSLAG